MRDGGQHSGYRGHGYIENDPIYRVGLRLICRFRWPDSCCKRTHLRKIVFLSRTRCEHELRVASEMYETGLAACSSVTQQSREFEKDIQTVGLADAHRCESFPVGLHSAICICTLTTTSDANANSRIYNNTCDLHNAEQNQESSAISTMATLGCCSPRQAL